MTLLAKGIDQDLNIDELLNDIQGSIADLRASLGASFDEALSGFMGALRDFSSGDWFNTILDSSGDKFLEFAFDLGDQIAYIADGVNVFFSGSQSWTRPLYSDPLALDLDGDGIETTGISNWQATTLFDHDADGVADGTGWLSGDDGWLVRDLDANGTIDSGAELFGDNTVVSGGVTAAEGFSALSDLDSNSDGVIDAADAAFGELKVWQDINQDGVSQAGELSSLTDLGIASIDLAATEVNQAQNGNNIQATSSFTRTDGTTGTIANLDLAESTFYTEFTDANAGDSTLPDMHGAGAVRNLRDAASRSASLASVLSQYSTANHDGQLALLDSLIDSWTATSGMTSMVERAEDAGFLVLYEFGNQPTIDDTQVLDAVATITGGGGGGSGGVVGGGLSQGIGDAMDSQSRADYQKWFRIISVLERFNGEEFVDFERPTATNWTATIHASANPPSGGGGAVGTGFDVIRLHIEQAQLDLLEQAYNALRDSVYQGLLVQTRLRPYLNAIGLTMENGVIALDFTDLNAELDARFAANDVDAAWDLVEFDGVVGAQLRTDGWSPVAYLAEHLSASTAELSLETVEILAQSGTAILAADAGGTLAATPELQVLVGRRGDDVLTGDNGDNQLYGGDGNDSLDGGYGSDRLDGGSGDDSLFAGAHQWPHAVSNSLRGGPGDDSLTGSGYGDSYHYRLGDGRDVIHELGDADFADTLVLEDLNASDVWCSREDSSLVINVHADGGQIRIEDWYGGDQYQVESVHFADGTVWDRDTIHAKGLEVHGSGSADTLEGQRNQGDRLYGAAGDDIINGYAGDDELYGGDGNDSLDGGYGSDRLDGGAGDDSLFAGAHQWPHAVSNSLRGGPGDDSLTGSGYGDSYHYRLGDGRDVIHEQGNANFADTLVLEDLNASDVWCSREDSSLVVNVHADGGQIRIEDWYGGDQYQVESVHFADGTVWDRDTIHAKGLEVHGGGSADTLEGLSSQGDRLYGAAGDDIINGYAGDDELYGGDGNDRLDGGYGSDRLEGGAGDDSLFAGAHQWPHSVSNSLRGGPGDDSLTGSGYGDSYHYRLGDGRDVIHEQGDADFADTLVLEDLAPDQLWFERQGDDLVVSAIGTSDQVAVDDWYLSPAHQLEQFEAADGQALANNAVEQLVSAMAAFAKPAMGETVLTQTLRQELAPVLASSWQAS